jgi:murein DD-endopeptidase MepM/ murein hydrolase activator NlpD
MTRLAPARPRLSQSRPILRRPQDGATAPARTGRRILFASAVAVMMAWGGYTTVSLAEADRELERNAAVLAETRAVAARQLAERDARIQATRGDVDRLAAEAEQRHAALAMVLTELRDEPGAAAALAPTAVPVGATPAARLTSVRAGQAELMQRADAFARTQAEQRRRAFRAAGVRAPSPQPASGGPLIALPSLGADPAFAASFAKVAATLSELHVLDDAASTLPFGQPAEAARLTSSYGVRIDPITSTPAFHSGQDFAGAYRSPIKATAAGVVQYAGVRSGYGNVVEVDHGQGFMTRYAHLATIAVRAGQQVEPEDVLGGMGSTGRSTGVHLHYEVWVNGRAQNPARFIKAGQYVGRD